MRTGSFTSTSVLLVVSLASLVSCAASDTNRPLDAAGGGGIPVSPELVGMWLSRAPAGEVPQPFVVVYFRGEAGWHDRAWESDFRRTPLRVSLSSEEVGLVVEQVDDTVVRIQGRRIDLASGNVFLVSGLPDDSRIETVGRVEVVMKADSVPVLEVLAGQPEIRRAVGAK